MSRLFLFWGLDIFIFPGGLVDLAQTQVNSLEKRNRIGSFLHYEFNEATQVPMTSNQIIQADN